MDVFVYVGVVVGASQRIPLSVLARNLHKGLEREISHETGRKEKADNRSEQNRPGQSTEQGSQQEREREGERERERERGRESEY